MTKVIILGEEPKEKKKKIEFVKALDKDLTWFDPESQGHLYKNVELISKANSHIQGYDVMFAYDDYRCNGVVILGHFNDGIV